MIDVDYPELLKLFPEHLVPGRNESAAFLIWYLEHYYRLDSDEAVDCVCDERGDRGVDGIFVNDSDQTITILQSRITTRVGRTVGDSGLRELVGTMEQFKTVDGIEKLISDNPASSVAQLAERLKLAEAVTTHDIQGEFVANMDIDLQGSNYLKTVSNVTFVGKSTLLSTYISDARDIPERAPITFDIRSHNPAIYLADNTKAIIVPIKATELVTMDGVSDQSLFAHNVRGPLGRTQVNKDIAASIDDPARHKMFPLFHNGITVIARNVDTKNGTLTVSNYHVVNGCQSITSFFNKRAVLTDDLRVLVKFIEADPRSALAERVTQFSNNQNGVRSRDFKANSPIQIRLKNEMNKLYPGEYYYEIKRGEDTETGKVIPNETAGLYMRAFDLKGAVDNTQKI